MNAPERRSMYRAGRVLVTSVLLLALIAPVLSPLAGTDLRGWFPEHGHATFDGVVAPHTHPWDAEAADEGDGGLAFTAGDLLGAPAIPVASVALLLIPLLVAHAARMPRSVPVRALALAPEPPPPR